MIFIEREDQQVNLPLRFELSLIPCFRAMIRFFLAWSQVQELKRVAFPYLICIWDSFIVVCCLCSVNFRFRGARHRKLQSTQSYLLPRIVKDIRCPPDLLCEMASKKVMQDRLSSFFHNWSKMSLLRLSGIRHGHEGAIPFRFSFLIPSKGGEADYPSGTDSCWLCLSAWCQKYRRGIKL